MSVLLCDAVGVVLQYCRGVWHFGIVFYSAVFYYRCNFVQIKMKIIEGNADAITCAGSMFAIVSGGKVIETVRKHGATSDAMTSVVDGRSVITFTLKAKTGNYKIECTPAEWRDISDARGLIDKAIVVAKKTAVNINKQITRNKSCCGK